MNASFTHARTHAILLYIYCNMTRESYILINDDIIMNNSNLHTAKKEKNDEFYTRYEDIEKEIKHYDLKGLSVYSPCDDYRHSNFVKYFTDNFQALGITKYCATNYDIGEGSYKYEYDGKGTKITRLEGNGDFRSEECSRIRDEYDIVITNPPFSLFRDFIKWLE